MSQRSRILRDVSSGPQDPVPVLTDHYSTTSYESFRFEKEAYEIRKIGMSTGAKKYTTNTHTHTHSNEPDLDFLDDTHTDHESNTRDAHTCESKYSKKRHLQHGK